MVAVTSYPLVASLEWHRIESSFEQSPEWKWPAALIAGREVVAARPASGMHESSDPRGSGP
jgi:hypothetical protein